MLAQECPPSNSRRCGSRAEYCARLPARRFSFIATAALVTRVPRGGRREPLSPKPRSPRDAIYRDGSSARARRSPPRSRARGNTTRDYLGSASGPPKNARTERFIGWFCLKYIPATVASRWDTGSCLQVGGGVTRPRVRGRSCATDSTFLGLYRIIGLTHSRQCGVTGVLQKAGLRDAGWDTTTTATCGSSWPTRSCIPVEPAGRYPGPTVARHPFPGFALLHPRARSGRLGHSRKCG